MSEALSTQVIDFSDLSPEQFENLIYFLLDDMGFKNIEWRKGGDGISATDGGRDLEAMRTQIGAAEQLALEKWWVEVKYRSRVLPPDTVQKIVLNAWGRPHVDVLAIVTNNVISNKATDWIKEFASTNPKPQIIVWQSHDLDLFLHKYSATRERFFYGTLTTTERLEATERNFWNAVAFPTPEILNEFWTNREGLEWNGSNLLPIVITEASSGRLSQHRWGMVIGKELLRETLVLGLANSTPIILRLIKSGRDHGHLLDGLGYLLEVALLRLDLQDVADVAVNPNKFTNATYDWDGELRDLIMCPLVANMYRELLRNCSLGCERFDNVEGAQKNAASFFHRFVVDDRFADDKPFVLIQYLLKPCRLNLVAATESCPLCNDIPENSLDEETLRHLLTFAQGVIRRRALMNTEGTLQKTD